jgi:hypothetical protein
MHIELSLISLNSQEITNTTSCGVIGQIDNFDASTPAKDVDQIDCKDLSRSGSDHGISVE